MLHEFGSVECPCLMRCSRYISLVDLSRALLLTSEALPCLAHYLIYNIFKFLATRMYAVTAKPWFMIETEIFMMISSFRDTSTSSHMRSFKLTRQRHALLFRTMLSFDERRDLLIVSAFWHDFAISRYIWAPFEALVAKKYYHALFMPRHLGATMPPRHLISWRSFSALAQFSMIPVITAHRAPVVISYFDDYFALFHLAITPALLL